MKKIALKSRSKKGFTLAELLIVIAIIAILVAIAIPTFTTALDKARRATEDANIRAAYAEYTVDTMLNSTYTGGKIIATKAEAEAKYFALTGTTAFSYYAGIEVDPASGRWKGIEK